jgi:hypothetical protein
MHTRRDTKKRVNKGIKRETKSTIPQGKVPCFVQRCLDVLGGRAKNRKRYRSSSHPGKGDYGVLLRFQGENVEVCLFVECTRGKTNRFLPNLRCEGSLNPPWLLASISLGPWPNP